MSKQEGSRKTLRQTAGRWVDRAFPEIHHAILWRASVTPIDVKTIEGVPARRRVGVVGLCRAGHESAPRKLRAILDSRVQLTERDYLAHELTMHVRLLRHLGGRAERVSDIWPTFWLDQEDQSFAETLVGQARVGRISIVCCPGTSNPCKAWDPARYGEVFGQLPAANVFAVGTGQERGAINASGPKWELLDICGRTSLSQLAALIARCDLFVGVDSGPLHMAITLGRPTVAITGGLGFGKFLPWGRREINRLAAPRAQRMLLSARDTGLCRVELSKLTPSEVGRECKIALLNDGCDVRVSGEELALSAEREAEISDLLGTLSSGWQELHVWR